MSYTKTNWQNGITDLNEANMNKIENELEAVDKSLKYNGGVPADWNDAKTFGVYGVGGSTYSNAPISEPYGILIVYENRGETWTPSTASWIWQEFRDTNGNIYKRHAVNTSDSWTRWVPYYSDYIENPTFSINSNVITNQGLTNIVSVGKMVIVNFECQISNLSQWQEYVAITLNGITSNHIAIGVLSCQSPDKSPISVYITQNSNQIKFNPYGNTFTGEDWFRGQLVFIAN